MPPQVWKTDRLLGDLWTTLQDELKSLADEIRNKPRDHGKLLVIAGACVSSHVRHAS